jgi:hypothetical protein
MISIATPTKTNAVNKGNNLSQHPEELSRAVMELSNADIELSKAEVSVGRLEAVEIKHAAITIVALLCLVGVKIDVGMS